MGEHEGCAQPSGLLPNGLLPNAGPLIRVLDSERWLKAEEKTAELIACIQPNQPSEERRNAVADYVQRLITTCFPCQVFTFGSVPLKTYLPDGDIDLTAFSDNQNLKDTWANQVRDMLENEEKNENAEFHVKEVQYIQAEVKIIKCLVENIVVDISFNQLGGLCTLCFLEEVDHLINQNHLFKRSIILIKAWCYYESRILGAHHGLISTYALETLVLYIFHVFNNSFAGPLEVLYRFLEFFSNFDWDNFCVSLWGPVPINSLPDVTAEPPRKDSGDLLLSKLFLNACSSVYAVFPGGQENRGQPFVSKHFNVIDPLRVNNNLGRSVSKGNFFRIRSAFAFGAKRLARLLDCPKENLAYEVNQFFLNTWDRHGSGNRPDAPRSDLWRLRLPTSDHQPGAENLKQASYRRTTDSLSGCDSETEGTHSNSVPSQSTYRTADVSAHSRTQSQKTHGMLNRTRAPDTVREVNSNQGVYAEKSQRNLKPDHLVNDIQGRFLFARTHSSPELTDTYGDAVPHGRRNKALESGKNQAASARTDNSRRKNVGSELLANHGSQSSNDDTSSVRRTLRHQNPVAASDSNNDSNAYKQDSGLGIMNDECASATGTQGLHQDERDIMNLMASSAAHGFNGQVHLPLNSASADLPFTMSPSILASMGYAPRNLGGMVQTNITFIDPAFSNMQFPHGLVSPQLANYFPGIGLTSNSEESIEPGNEIFGSMEMNSGEGDHDFWQEQDVGPIGDFGSDARNIEGIQSDDKPQLNSSSLNYTSALHLGSSGGSVRPQQKYTKDKRGSMWEDRVDNFHNQDNRGSDFYSEERALSSKFSSAAHSSSMRSKTSSESSWDGSSTKTSKSTKERRGKKTISADPATGYGKGKTTSDHVSVHAEEDDPDWNLVSNMGCDVAERSSGSRPLTSLHVTRHHMPGYEPAQTSGSDPMIPMAPMLLGPGPQQRMMDNSGVFPFVLTGPPVPFVMMLHVYSISPETGASDATTNHFSCEEGLENSDSGHNFNISGGVEHTQEFNAPSSVRGSISAEASDEHKSDILNSDFASHWKNLQYGRFCQDSRFHGPLIYSSPTMVPPSYLQSHFPWDGPGRPFSTNMNLFTQLMNYGPRFLPVAPLQPVSNRPPNVYQHYVDDLPRHRSGTGTYLPNPKVSVRDRHSSGTRRGNYNYDRIDSHRDREGNWNINSRPRAAGRGHNRNQGEKSGSRLNRLASSESRPDRSWTSHRHESFSSYQTQNGPLSMNSTQGGPPNVAYSLYPVQAMNQNGVSSSEPSVPSVVMLCPFDNNAGYGSHAEQLEFGSLGPMGFSGVTEHSQPNESRMRGEYDEHRFHGAAQLSSPEQPSSPQHQRSVAQRNYHLKDEDFPPLRFPNQIENDGDSNYDKRSSCYQAFIFSAHS